MKYKICIAIPIKSVDLNTNKQILETALEKSPDLIELRFDYIINVQTISLDFIKDLMNIITSNTPVIFTFRDPSEGGKIKIDQKERSKILKMFIEAKPEYIDIEMNTNQNFLYEIINLASQNGVKIIFSYHNFENTLTYDESIKLIQIFKIKLTQELSLTAKVYKNIIYKMVFTAQTFEDNIVPLRLCKEFSNSTQKLISFCMGPLGIFSRIMCVTVGSFLTYASLEEKTAPGQIHIDEMREIYNLFLKNL